MTKDEETAFAAARYISEIEHASETIKEAKKLLKALQTECAHKEVFDNRCSICFKKL